MAERYLEITYRKGKPLAAYLYLDRRPGDKSSRTERHETWIIDFAADGRPIGIEFTHIGVVDLPELNRVLATAHYPALSRTDLVPLQAA
jgi:hypothetical protein